MFSSFREFWKKSRKKESQGKLDNRTSKLRVESLENREMLTAVAMTEFEQLFLELVNRARMDPLGEVARNSEVSDLNQGLDPGTISSTPKQPVASVQELTDAGENHALDMLANDYFSHFSQNGDSPTDRAAAVGYVGSVGENIAWNGSTGPINNLEETLLAHDELFKSASHRQNLMWDAYEEAGMSVEFGLFTSGGNTFNAVMVAQEFGYNSGNPYLTGVAYDDSVTDDDFYSLGESESGILITADDGNGNIFTTSTGASGGYNVKLPAGTYTVTASGGSLSTDMVTTNVVIGTENVKVDFDTSTAPVVNQDIVGFTSNAEFWAGISNGSTLSTSYWGSFSSSNTFSNLGVGDFNGDGFDDVAGRAATGELVVAISDGSGSFSTSTWGNLTTITNWTDIFVGDFNGDGLDDLLGRADSDGTLWLAESNGSSFTNEYWGKLTTAVTWSDISVGDFDGNGMDDIASRAQDGTWWASISNGSALQNSYWGRWSTSVTWSDVSVGDFDGNGMDDIAGRANNTHWWINTSTSSYFVVKYWGNWTGSVTWVDTTVGDFNGDGFDDIAGRANGQWWIAMSNGTSLSNQYWGYWTTSTTWHDTKLIDINSDGLDDLIGRAANGKWWAFQSNGTTFSGSLVTSWSPTANWDFVGVGNFA